MLNVNRPSLANYRLMNVSILLDFIKKKKKLIIQLLEIFKCKEFYSSREYDVIIKKYFAPILYK